MTTVTLTLPDGIANIECINESMIGSYLRITFDNGFVAQAHALNLAERECGLSLFTPEHADYFKLESLNDPLPCVNVDFDVKAPTSVEQYADSDIQKS